MKRLFLTTALLSFAAISYAGPYFDYQKTGQVVDSMTVSGKTINAVYSATTNYGTSGDGYQCADLVKKYYSTVYGITVSNLTASLVPPASSDKKKVFKVVTTPAQGDIAFWKSGPIGVAHFAIVKSTSSSQVVFFEQNNKWWEKDNKTFHAAVGRKLGELKWPTPVYYRLMNI